MHATYSYIALPQQVKLENPRILTSFCAKIYDNKLQCVAYSYWPNVALIDAAFHF
jgi:hypothetical protein